MGFIGGHGKGLGKIERYVYTAVGSETTVTTDDLSRTILYNPGNVDVFLNGAKLVSGDDFNATSGNSITGLSALTANDVLEVVSFDGFATPDSVSKSYGGVFSGAVDFESGLTATTGVFSGAVDFESGLTSTTGVFSGEISANSFTGNGEGLSNVGKVLQVIKNNSAVSTNTTSTSYVDVANFSVVITPNSVTNKILVICSANILNSLVASTNAKYHHQLVRNSTALQATSLAAESASGGLQAKGSLNITYLDSPTTVSPITYKIQHKTSHASSRGFISDATIVVMEILA